MGKVVSLIRLRRFSGGVILPRRRALSGTGTSEFSLVDAAGTGVDRVCSLFLSRSGDVRDVVIGLSNNAPSMAFMARSGVARGV